MNTDNPKNKAKLLVVVPHFEDESFSLFYQSLQEKVNSEFTLIIVDDASQKRRVDTASLKGEGQHTYLISLESNVGHQKAISVGLAYAVENFDFEALVIMDSDGEDDPADIAALCSQLKHSKKDVVVAQRRDRKTSYGFKFFYSVYKFLFRVLVGRTIDFGNFMAMTKGAASQLTKSSATQTHIAASVLKSKLEILSLPLDRGARLAGESKMNLTSLTLHGLRAITVFSEEVIVRIILVCSLFGALVLAALFAMVVMKFSGLTIAGWFSTVTGILLLALMQISIISLIALMMFSSKKSNEQSSSATSLGIKHIQNINE